MVHPARPKYRDNADFLVRFEPADGPGFYPGAGGFFHGCTLPQEPRVVFYGTDFGTTCEAGAARAMGGEAENQRTIKRLRELVEEVACDTGEDVADWCYLTNAVLGLAKLKPGIVKGNDDTHKAYSKREHQLYRKKCGKAHRDWLRGRRPVLVVLLGSRHFNVYAPVWSVALPELFDKGGEWRDATMCQVLAGGPVRDAGAGRRVQVMYHPSSRGDWDRCRVQARDTLASEVRRLAESGCRRAVRSGADNPLADECESTPPVSDPTPPRWLLNNLHGDPHAELFGDSMAFFDLDKGERYDRYVIKAGDECVVVSPDTGHVKFSRFRFSHEAVRKDPRRARDGKVRVLFGKKLKSETLSRAAAAEPKSPYYRFFDKNGHFKTGWSILSGTTP